MPSQRYTSGPTDLKRLGLPLQFPFSRKTAQNRLMKAAMAENLSTWDPNIMEARGIPTKELINAYRRWGEVPDNFGLIVTSNIVIEYDHLETVGNPVITPESKFQGARFDAFQELASAAPKKIKNALGLDCAEPRAATEADITRITTGFVHAAEYLQKAGFDGIELHAAHGFLLAQFLSQSTNCRADGYGGSLENRARLILDIAKHIRQRTAPDFILGIKINSVEFQEQGFSTDEAQQLCTMLESANFDFVEVSGGTYEHLAFEHKKESTWAREAFLIDFAEVVVASQKRMRAYVTGGLRGTAAMVAVLDVVDGVGLAKPAAQEPALGRHIIEGKVTGAVKPVDAIETSFPASSMAAGTLIRQLGKGQMPFDTTDDVVVQRSLKDMQQ